MRVLSDGAARDLAGRVWAHRAAAERVSSARYRRLAAGLSRCGVPATLVERAETAAVDEARHAELCAAMAEELGAAVPEALPTPTWRPLRGREDTLREAVGFCALAESMNATLMAVALRRTTHASTAGLLRALLADEVQHARLGWAILTYESSRGGCAGLSEGLVPMLEQAVSEELREAGSAPTIEEDGDGAADAGAGYGLLSSHERLALIAATLRDVIVPGLELAGVDAGSVTAWRQRHLPG